MATISLRIPEDLHQAIRIVAAEDRRPVSHEILWMLEQAIREREWMLEQAIREREPKPRNRQ